MKYVLGQANYANLGRTDPNIQQKTIVASRGAYEVEIPPKRNCMAPISDEVIHALAKSQQEIEIKLYSICSFV